MNTEFLKEFVVLAETKNFWEASERLYMNQSTLSKHIKSLENELGVELFTRTTRRVELTSYGQTFLPYARTIARTEFEGTSAVKRLQNIENAGFIPDIIFTSHRIDSILDMVTNQDCVALLMDKHMELPDNGPTQINVPWKTIPVSPEINSQISLCYRTDKPLSNPAQNFVDFCTSRLFGLS